MANKTRRIGTAGVLAAGVLAGGLTEGYAEAASVTVTRGFSSFQGGGEPVIEGSLAGSYSESAARTVDITQSFTEEYSGAFSREGDEIRLEFQNRRTDSQFVGPGGGSMDSTVSRTSTGVSGPSFFNLTVSEAIVFTLQTLSSSDATSNSSVRLYETDGSEDFGAPVLNAIFRRSHADDLSPSTSDGITLAGVDFDVSANGGFDDLTASRIDQVVSGSDILSSFSLDNGLSGTLQPGSYRIGAFAGASIPTAAGTLSRIGEASFVFTATPVGNGGPPNAIPSPTALAGGLVLAGQLMIRRRRTV